jgi:hypothetical protein
MKNFALHLVQFFSKGNAYTELRIKRGPMSVASITLFTLAVTALVGSYSKFVRMFAQIKYRACLNMGHI